MRHKFSSGVLLLFLFAFLSVVPAKNLFSQEQVSEEAGRVKTREGLIRSGKLYYDSGKYEAAVQQWEEALLTAPGDKKIKKYIVSGRKKMTEQAKREAVRQRKEAEKQKREAERKKREEERRKKKEKSFNKEVGLINMGLPQQSVLQKFSLDDCIKIAMANNIQMQVAQKSVKLGEMRLFEARRNMLPSATINFEVGDGRVNARRYISRKQSIEGQQPIFHGGELYFGVKQAEINLEVIRKDYDRIKNDLVLQVKKAFYSLAKSKENLKAQRELADEVEKIFGSVTKQFEGGVAAKLEYLNVTSQASQVRYQLASAEGDVGIAELILKQAMNLDTKEGLEIESKLEFKKVNIDSSEALRAAFMNRPEIKINSLMIDYYRRGIDIAKAKGWPKIDLLGMWGLMKDEYASLDQDHNPASGPDNDNRSMSPQWYAGIKTSMPFWGSTVEVSRTKEHWPPVVSTYHGTESDTTSFKFKFLDKLDYYSDRQLAEIDLDKQRQELNKIKQDITLEVMESCFTYEKALIQFGTASNKLKYQQTDVDVLRVKRSMDEVPDSSVVESMIKLAQEKFGYVQALSDCHTSLASINKAIGVEDYFKEQ
ncbi:MAG: TolC family protein [Candidatus Omnitrophica bacterium]|nr:TolC family protein [Candidatus Omnitrophota bacterium]